MLILEVDAGDAPKRGVGFEVELEGMADMDGVKERV